MANRYDFYYEQLVLEDELDGAFTALETSDNEMMSDTGTCRDDTNPSEFGGIFDGFDASHTTGLSQSITDGAGYDASGRRVGYAAPGGAIVVNGAATGTTAAGQGGVPTGGTSTSPDSGKERWVTTFIVYDRLLSDPRYDGYNNLVYFARAESFHFYVSMGEQKVIGSLLTADKPARESGKLLISDMRIQNVGGVVSFVSLDQDRKEIFFRVTTTGSPQKSIAGSTARSVIKQFLQTYNDHVGGRSDKHPASGITYAGGKTWADGTGGNVGAATTVQAAIDGIVDDLAATTERAGAKRIGAKAQVGSLPSPPPSQASPLSLSASTLESQLAAIMNAINSRVFRGGDNGIAGDLLPTVVGKYLGSVAQPWDAVLRDVAITALKSNLVPDGNLTRNLGAALAKFAALYVGDVNATNVTAATKITSDGDLLVKLAAEFWNDCFVNDGKFSSVMGHASDCAALLSVDENDLQNPEGSLLKMEAIRPGTNTKGAVLNIRPDGLVALPVAFFYDGFMYYGKNSGTNALSDHVPAHIWQPIQPADGHMTYLVRRNGTLGSVGVTGLEMSLGAGVGVDFPYGIVGPTAWRVDGSEPVTMFVLIMRTGAISTNMRFSIGLNSPETRYTNGFDVLMTPNGVYGEIWPSDSRNAVTGAVNLIGGPPALNTPYLLRMTSIDNSSVFFLGPSGQETVTAADGDTIEANKLGQVRAEMYSNSGVTAASWLQICKVLVTHTGSVVS